MALPLRLPTRRSLLLVTSLLLVGLAGAIAAQPAAKITKRKLPPEINSPAREILPIVSPDGRTLYFTREFFVDEDVKRRALAPLLALGKEVSPQMLAQLDNDPSLKQMAHQTIWYTERQPDGSWGKPIKMPPPLNGAFPSGVCSALPDNNTLLVGGQFGAPDVSKDIERVMKEMQAARSKPGAKPTQAQDLELIMKVMGGQKPAVVPPFGVALTRRAATGWTDPEYLRIKDFVNLGARSDYALAPGNRVLILSIEGQQSVGQRDLYVSFQNPDGTWSAPRDLAAPLNSVENEMSPFVAADGKSLYFASNRPGGLGGYDIYLTRRLDDTWLAWAPPRNLGPEINSPQDEVNLTVDASGAYAFMALGTLREEDLYEFALAPEMRPQPVAFVRGTVKNPRGQPVAATVAYERLKDGVGAGAANSHPSTGHYQIALPIGQDYAFRAEAPNHIPVSERLDLTAAKEAEVVERDLVLVPIAVGASVRLNNIFFKSAEAVLLPESKMELDRLVALLGQHPTMEIQIAGHTDSEGADAANQKLSEARAGAVRTYLVEHGIPAARLQAKGFGETKPVATNETPEGRQLNRRVEFTILKE